LLEDSQNLVALDLVDKERVQLQSHLHLLVVHKEKEGLVLQELVLQGRMEVVNQVWRDLLVAQKQQREARACNDHKALLSTYHRSQWP
jgi:hypothetical protein